MSLPPDNLWVIGDESDDLPAAEARLGQAYGINPEQAAKIDALAKRAKLPLPAAENQADLLGAQLQAQDHREVLAKSPKTRAFVAADKGNADMLQDHVGQATWIEPRWELMKRAGAFAGRTLGAAAFRMSSGLWGAIEASAESPRLLPESEQSRDLRRQAAQFARNQRLYGQASADAMTVRTGTWWGDALVSGVESGAQSAALAAASVMTRNPAPMLAGMGLTTGGTEYGKARDAGQSPLRSLNYAGGQAAFEVLTEMIPASVLLRGLKEGKGPLTTFLKSMAAEVPGEQVATLTQDLNEWVTLNPDKPMSQFLAERPQAAAETFLATLTSTGGNVAVASAADAVLRRIAERDEQAQEAPTAAKAFDRLVKDTVSMPLLERSPERFKALMDAQTEGVDVHVNAKALGTFLQSLEPEEQAIVIEGAGIGAQLAAATADTDIVIPAGAYLTYVAPEGHTFLQKDIRLGPSAMSVNEAEAHKEEREQMLAEAASQALGEGAQQAQIVEPVERVRQHFYDSAIAIGVPADQAAANAALQASYYAQRAARNSTFKDAWDAYTEANISMRGRGQTAEGPRGMGAEGGPAFDFAQGTVEAGALKNPTREQFTKELNASVYKHLRGIIAGRDVFIWDADTAIHADKAEELGIDYENAKTFEISVDKNTGRAVFRAPEQDYMDATPSFQHRSMTAILNNPDIDVYDEEGIDLIPGDKFAAQFQQDTPKAKGPRGQVSFSDQGALIELFKSRNASTLIHEGAGHIWLENLARDAVDPNASDEVRADLQAVKDWWLANIDQAVKESGLPEKRLRAAVEGFGGSPGLTAKQIPPDEAKALNYKTKMPTDPLFKEAVENTQAAKLTKDGLQITLVRNQKPEQHGATSVRTGVFYLPKGSPNLRYYNGKDFNAGYGGSDRIEGETLLRRPLFVKGATGGKAPEAAFEAIKGKGSYKKLEQDIMHVVGGVPVLRKDGLAEEAVDELLSKYGASTDTTWEILENSKKGNQLRYALQENIIAHVVREAGYDSVIGYSKGKAGASISEVFDVREDAYPTPQGDFSVHPSFYQGKGRKSANADVEAIRPFHEMFARAAEQYVMEGKAPSESLRTVFAKFRQWLVGIYKDFTALRVPMTDEMRGVFDRLVAGPEAIADAVAEQGFAPSLSRETFNSDEEYAAYLDSVKRADEAGEDRLLARLLTDIRRKYTDAWKAERAGLVEDFQAEVNDTPIMKAVSMLETGEVRLDRDAVQSLLGERAEADLYRRARQYVFAEGVHPDAVAEQVGLSSGQELVDQLLALKEEHDALRAVGDKRTVRVARAEALADAEMLARHGDILNDGTIGDEAMAALHDVRRSEVLMAEVRALVRKAGASTVLWTEAEMAAWAQRKIGAQQVAEVRPHVYAAAEAKAGRDALKALVKDDFQAALDAKFRQLLNAHLYRAARDAREKIEKGKTLFDKITSARDGTISKSRNMDMVGAARQILRSYGYGSPLHDEEYMSKVAMYDPELWADLRDPITAAMAYARPGEGVDVLNLDQFDSLAGIVDQLWRMSRVSRQMQIELETLELEDIANDLSDALGNVAPRANAHAPTNTEHALRILSGFRAALRRVESWVTGIDGGNKGSWRTYVWQPVSDAATNFRVAKAQYLNRFIELLAPIQKDLKRGKIEAPELGYTFGHANGGVGKSELLHALLHTGNDSNKRKLLLGRGWATERQDGSLDTTIWDQFLARMHREGVITEADWQFAQGVWDLLEEMKPAAQKAHRQVFGRYFEEVTANPVVTPFGTLRGGYVPAIVDRFLDQNVELKQAADSITDANDASMFPSPNRGFTKSRVEYNSPLQLDLGLLPQHIDKVLKFTHMTAPVRDVLRLLKEKGLSGKLEAFDAAVVPDLLLPWLNRAAKQVVETPSKGNAGRGWDAFFRAVRHRTGMGIMIANVSNTLQQLTGWAPAALKVRKRSLTRALWQVTRDPAGMMDAIQAMSPYMATRTTALTQETNAQIERLLLDPTKFQKITEFSQRHAYIMQSLTQNLVDMVTWTGAFEDAIERGEDLPEAARFADSVIRETQGSLAPEDVSRFEVGPPVLRMFTQFYSYFNVQSNLWVTEFKNSKTLTRSAYVYIMGIMLPAILSEIIRVSFGAGWDDDDDDGYLDQFLDVFFGSQFRYIVGAIPVAGQVLATMANQFNDRPYDDKLVPAPAISTVEQLAKWPEDLWLASTEGKRQKAAVRETATLLTLLTGVPLFNVAARPLGYAADINEGKVQPTSGLDLARGLVTGAASEESRVN